MRVGYLGIKKLLRAGVGLLALGYLVADQKAQARAGRGSDGRSAPAAHGVTEQAAQHRAHAGAFGLGAVLVGHGRASGQQGNDQKHHDKHLRHLFHHVILLKMFIL